MSERPTKTTYSIPDVIEVPEYRVLVSVSRIEHLQTMRFISLLLTMIGGVVAGIGNPIEFLIVGIALIVIGILIEYQKVHKVLGEWKESERRGTFTYTGDTVTETTEYEEAQ